MPSVQKIPSFPQLLWDVDPDQVDLEKHAGFLIPRIMDRGTMEHVMWAWDFYGAGRIQDVLVQAPCLQKKTIAFFACQFGIPREAFRATRKRNDRWEP